MASNEPSEILDGLIHIYECDEQKVSGVIAPTDGIYRENLSVYVQDGNTELASGTTDSNGIFNISFFLPVGQYDPIIKCGNNTKSIYESGLRSLACSLTLTSDKDILSAADNDFATLSATLKCTETNEFLSNRNITFEITKDDTVIQTLVSQTNSSGVATVTYESQGLGDISVTARIGSILTKTFVVHDYWKYIASGSKTFSTTSHTQFDIADLNDLTGDYEISVTLKSNATKGFGIALNNATATDNNNLFRVGFGGSNYQTVLRMGNGSIAEQYDTSTTYTANTDVVLKLTRVNGVYTGYVDSFSHSYSNAPSNPRYLQVESWSTSKTLTYSDFIVKPL